jgi:hypothetical protein
MGDGDGLGRVWLIGSQALLACLLACLSPLLPEQSNLFPPQAMYRRMYVLHGMVEKIVHQSFQKPKDDPLMLPPCLVE